MVPYHSTLQSAKLIKRYKRFLADIELSSGEVLTIHCPNTGSMLGAKEPGTTVWYSTIEGSQRKYPETWELAQTEENHFIGINTHRANPMVLDALVNGVIQELPGITQVRKEVKDEHTKDSRLDFCIEQGNDKICYLEVKNVTLCEEDVAMFPDAVTERGQKHLRALMSLKADGFDAAVLFCVQHTKATSFSPAAHIDPVYAQLLKDAMEAGVMVLVYGCHIDTDGACLKRPLPIHWPS